MTKKIKFGVVRETKFPPDRRVAIAPQQAIELVKQFPNVEVIVQPSDIRAYTNQEYLDLGITMQEDLSECDILAGVKEVAMEALIPDKTYLFFAHVAKQQPHNRKLLQEIIKRRITLLDHEYFSSIDGMRLVAFGRWAGIVGTYNGLMGYGLKYGIFNLKRAHECFDLDEFFAEVDKIKLPPIKILITGGGRVSHGAMEILDHLKVKKVTHYEFLYKTYKEAVYCQLDPWNYVARKDDEVFDMKHFFKHPYEYKSTFYPYTKTTDILIACHYWDNRSPVFMTKEDMRANDFKLTVISDISCDIPGPIPSTLRSSTIDEPFYGYNLFTEKEGAPFHKDNITVMAIDNLPGEAPRNASIDFGKDLIKKVLPSLFGQDTDAIIERATIVKKGKITPLYGYLQNFVDEK